MTSRSLPRVFRKLTTVLTNLIQRKRARGKYPMNKKNYWNLDLSTAFNRTGKTITLWVMCCVLLVSLFGPLQRAAATGEPNGPAAITPSSAEANGATPQFTAESLGIPKTANWITGGGFLYWASCPAAIPKLAAEGRSTQAVTAGGFLRRWSVGGGGVAYLKSDDFCDTDHWATDDRGLYYYDKSDKSIYRYGVADGAAPLKLSGPLFDEPVDKLVLNGNYLYYVMNNGLTGRSIFRVNRNGDDGTGSYLGDAGLTASNLISTGSRFYWISGGQLWQMGLDCLGSCMRALTAFGGRRLTNATGGTALSSTTEPFWQEDATIRGWRCTFRIGADNACSIRNQYTANLPPASPQPDTSYSTKITQMTTDGTFLFWIENVQQCTTSGFLICSLTNEGRLMKWRIRSGVLAIGQPPQPFETPEPIATQNSGGVTFSIGGWLTNPSNEFNEEQVRYEDNWVYFYTSRGLTRIRADAPPIRWDLTADSYEVTQGIQSLTNDVPLIAKKPTYVRVYSRKLDGPNANAVDAVLYGSRNGTPLPGSPLQPANGRLPINANVAPDRSKINTGWLFQLPDDWVTAGNIVLRPAVNTSNTYKETNLANNTLPDRTFNFQYKVPVCTIFVPIRTEAPATSTNDPNFWNMVERFKTLWPVSDVWVYHQDNDIAEFEVKWWGPFPYPGFGPYELWDNSFPADKDKVMVSLIERDIFSDDPDECDNVNAPTHLVGMVHPDANTGGLSGYANYWIDTSFVKLPPHDSIGLADQWSKPDAGSTMAQELSHNYNGLSGDRWKHVNCGGPDGVNGSYPYNPCTLDDKALNDPATHFGFDPLTLQIIPPNMAGDYMSYANNTWVSDYTYKGMIAELNATLVAQAQLKQDLQSNSRQVEVASGVVVVSGVFSPTSNHGELAPAWALPNTAMQRSLLRKLDTLNARVAKLHTQMHTQDAHSQSAHSQSADHSHADTAHATVRLLDANGTVLASKPVIASTGTHGGGSSYSFLDSLPIPAGSVATLDVIADDNTVIMSRTVSANAPTIALQSPAGGEAIDNHMTLTWTANDPDAHDTSDTPDTRFYTLQYSPNNGKTWRALFTDLPSPIDPLTNKPMGQVTMLLDKLDGLPGSDAALMRIMVSDGYNTASAISQPFSMTNRAPEPHIVSPGAYAQFPAGQMVLLKGNAMDAEQGGLSGTALMWSIDGVAAGTGSDVIVNGLAPGEHIAQLSATDDAGNTGSVTATLMIAPLAVPQTNTELTLNGDCNDAGYVNAVHLPLAKYADGSMADVQIVRDATQLWACFSGLKQASGNSPGSFVTLRIDPNFSRDVTTQADDAEIIIQQNGAMVTQHGNGGAWEPKGPTALNGRIRTEDSGDGLWNAELQIDASVFGGWNKVVGLMADHNWVTALADDHFWPRNALWNKPNTWAKVLLGDLPHIDALAAASAYVGDGDTTIQISGSNFITDSVAFWNGAAHTTTYISPTQISMSVATVDLTSAGMAQIQVANSSALDVAPSNTLPFAIKQRPMVSPPNARPLQMFMPMLNR